MLVPRDIKHTAVSYRPATASHKRADVTRPVKRASWCFIGSATNFDPGGCARPNTYIEIAKQASVDLETEARREAHPHADVNANLQRAAPYVTSAF